MRDAPDVYQLREDAAASGVYRVGRLASAGDLRRPLAVPHRLGVFGSSDNLARAGRPTHPGELNGHRCMVMSGASNDAVWIFEDNGATIRVPVAPTLRINSYRVLHELVAGGAGLARIPAMYADFGPASVEELLRDFHGPAKQAFAVYPSSRHVTPALRTMLEHLVRHFSIQCRPTTSP